MRIIALALLAGSLWAQSIAVTGGVAASQVVQRDSSGKANLAFSGIADGSDGKQIEARLTGGIRNLFSGWKKVADVSGGKWEVTLRDVSEGGPYKAEFRVSGGRQSASVEPVFVGDIWILAGQSNMEGVGDLIAVEQPDERVRMIDMVEEKWQRAYEPLHNLPGSVDRVHWRVNATKEKERFTGTKLEEFNHDRKKGAGLGLPFGVQYVKDTSVPVGLLPCAHGGTSMDQWDPAKWDKANPGESLYGSMMRRFALAGGKVKGILWYQGESDANQAAAPQFREKFEALIRAVRKDTGDADLPFYYVQIGRHVSAANVESWNQVQNIQRLVEDSVPATAVFSSIDSALDDQIHVSTPDLKRIGQNMAQFAAGSAKRGPRLKSVEMKDGVLAVSFDEVNGKLVSEGRVSGFSIHGIHGEEVQAIYKATIDKDKINLSIQGKLPEGAVLHYGFGKNPYCNVRDEEGFGVLAAGPISIQ